jgi:hypothetical protein
MSWLSLALTLLKIVATIMSWARERELIDQGYDKAIAEASQPRSCERPRPARPCLEKVNAMSDSDEVDALRGLEPK